MIEHHLDIATPDGAMNTFFIHPEEGGPHPVVLFFMDAPGKREELHQMARRLASAGYGVLLPNLYYRRSRDYWLQERTEAAMAVMFEHMASLNAATTRTDTQALLGFIATQSQLDGTRIGAVGYCMSGPIVMWAAVAFPERLKAIASIHGANMATQAPDSPHRIAPQLRCESYFACAEIDQWAPPQDVAALEAGLKQAAAPHRVEWYPQAQHGFVFPQRGAAYHLASAERHWERLHRLFQRTLQQA